MGKIDTVTTQTLDTVLAVNVRAPFLMIREAVARMATDRGGARGCDRQYFVARGRTRWCRRMDPLRRVEGGAGQPDDRRLQGTGARAVSV